MIFAGENLGRFLRVHSLGILALSWLVMLLMLLHGESQQRFQVNVLQVASNCGNAELDAGEQCDDGNLEDGDGCSSTCESENYCGNGKVDEGEQCDDGNTTSGDGCSGRCEVESLGCDSTVLYGIHDQGVADSVFFRSDAYTNQTKVIGTAPGYDIEGMAIHPETGLIYGFSGDKEDGRDRKRVVIFDRETGAFNLDSGPNLDLDVGQEYQAASFNPVTKKLWAGGTNTGLRTVDLATGASIQHLAITGAPPEAMAWDRAGKFLYMFQGKPDEDGAIIRFDQRDKSTREVCTLADIQAMEFDVNGDLYVSYNNKVQIDLYDLETCSVVERNVYPIPAEYDDIESVIFACEEANTRNKADEVCVNFAELKSGQSVEGPGKVHPLLTISSGSGNGQVLYEGDTGIYGAPHGDQRRDSGCLGVGFAEVVAQDQRKNDFSFEFASGVRVKDFSLRMMDFGDFNPGNHTGHGVSLVAYGADGKMLDQSVIGYSSSAETTPREGSFGDLYFTGDACTAKDGQPGNYGFQISNPGIKAVRLHYADEKGGTDRATDPGIAFKDLCFTLEERGDGVVCGDGVKEATEVCDDGNTIDGDGCSAVCELEDKCQEVSFVDFVSQVDGVTDRWSEDGQTVGLGSSSWSLLGGSARVTGFKNDLKHQLTHRLNRGLGVGGQENDEIDSRGEQERMEVVFDPPRYVNNLELRSLAGTDDGGVEKADVDMYLGNRLVQSYQVNGGLGSDNGVANRSIANHLVDRLVFYVKQGQDYTAGSEFALAKINVCTQKPPAFCGNGVVEEGEACDDNNFSDGDGCSAVCQIEEKTSCQAKLNMHVWFASNHTVSDVANIANLSREIFLGSNAVQSLGKDGVSIPLTNGEGAAPIVDELASEFQDNVPGVHVQRGKDASGSYFEISSYGFNNTLSRESYKAWFGLESAKVVDVINGPDGAFEITEGQGCGINEEDVRISDPFRDEYNIAIGGSEGLLCSTTHSDRDRVRVYYETDELCRSVCGNGLVEAGEQCDDGNRNDGDGCNAVCVMEETTSCEATFDLGINYAANTGNNVFVGSVRSTPAGVGRAEIPLTVNGRQFALVDGKDRVNQDDVDGVHVYRGKDARGNYVEISNYGFNTPGVKESVKATFGFRNAEVISFQNGPDGIFESPLSGGCGIQEGDLNADNPDNDEYALNNDQQTGTLCSTVEDHRDRVRIYYRPANSCDGGGGDQAVSAAEADEGVSRSTGQLVACGNVPIPAAICKMKTDYAGDVVCSGDFMAKNETDLEDYISDGGVVNGSHRNLVIDFDVQRSSLEVHSPCAISVTADHQLKLKGRFCLDGREGVDLKENVDIEAVNVALLSEDGGANVARSARIEAEDVYISGETQAVIAEQAELKVAENLTLIGRDVNARATASIGRGAKVNAARLYLDGAFAVALGGGQIDIDKTLTMVAHGGNAIVRENSKVVANDFCIESPRKAVVGQGADIHVNDDLDVVSSSGELGTFVKLARDVKVFALDKVRLNSANIAELGENVNISARGEFMMKAVDVGSCIFQAGVNFAAVNQLSGNCLEGR